MANKRRKKTYGAVGVSSATLYSAKKIGKGFQPYNKETSYKTRTVNRSINSKLPQYAKNPRVFSKATQRVSTTKAYSKYGVKTTSTLTETYHKSQLKHYTHHDKSFRTSTRSTTLSGRGKLSKLGQIVIQEMKPAESLGEGYADKTGKTYQQGGKGGGKGRYKTKSITYARKGYPTPKRGRIPKGGNPVVSSLKRTGMGAYSKIDYFVDDLANVHTIKTGGSKGKNVYKSIVSPQSKAGRYIQSKSAPQLLSTVSKAGKVAGKVLARANAAGVALAAYDAYKALDAYSKTSGPKKQMAKYQSQGGFSHMTSNPKNRGKQGLDF